MAGAKVSRALHATRAPAGQEGYVWALRPAPGPAVTDVLQVTAERAPFVMLPRWLLLHSGISDGAKVLYGMLHDLVAGREGPTRPVTRGQLAGCCGVSVATVDRRLAELVDAGAIEKRAQFETRQGQVANVYWVRLSPPAAQVRPPVDTEREGGCKNEDPPAPEVRPGGLQPWGRGGCTGEAPDKERKQEQETPPQPPRRAGGQGDRRGPPTLAPGAGEGSASSGGARPAAAATSSRAQGTNPRAAAELAEAVRREAATRSRELELERITDSRRAADRAAHVEADRWEAEALAVSAALDDGLLAGVVDAVRAGMAGPLAASALGVARAVIAWCRAATDGDRAQFADAVRVGLAEGLTVEESGAPPLDLPPAPAGTTPLRSRVAALIRPVDVEAGPA